MKPTRNWSALQQTLQQDTESSQQLLQLMLDERKALEERDYTAFEALIKPKQTLLAQLEQNVAARRAWLSQHRIANDTDALQLAETEAPETAAYWRSTADIWRECQTANQINEQISRRTRAIVGHVLDALRGQHQQSAVYDAKGMADRGSSGRIISNA